MIKGPTNEWGWLLESAPVRPASPTFGTSVTPVQNAYGAYAQLISGAALTDDIYLIDLVVHGVAIAATARNCVVSVGLDPAGGTAYTSVAELLIGPSGAALSGGVRFRLPYFVKAGTSIGISAAVSSVSVVAVQAYCTVYGRPSRPELIKAGGYIDSFGIALASSGGVAITPGQAADGAWVEVGTLTRPCWHITYGYSISNTVMALQSLHVDLSIGDLTNKKIVLTSGQIVVTTGEDIYRGVVPIGADCMGAIGDKVYARAQSSAVPETGHTVAITVIGG